MVRDRPSDVGEPATQERRDAAGAVGIDCDDVARRYRSSVYAAEASRRRKKSVSPTKLPPFEVKDAVELERRR